MPGTPENRSQGPLSNEAAAVKITLGEGGQPVSHFAVPELRRRTVRAYLHRLDKTAKWHAVADYAPLPITTLCGFQSKLDPHRTWDQTLPEARCPRCEQLTVAAQAAQDATVAADPTEGLEPVKAELLKRRIMENA
jgi:hypothetical protein